ncbi:rhodanese-like domain-containing protein [Streptomyces sp. NBC_01235]|uniref:rhodanese-like domain-containing protein n=1 Tax=Streptomyces sp. NBC_01235 TaxID=2903788 RepID=UPI003FA347B7
MAHRTTDAAAPSDPAGPTTGLTTAQAAARLGDCTVVDVRTPGEYAGGHLPGAHNIALDRLGEAASALGAAAAHGPLLLVCASGNRSAKGCARLAALGVEAATLEGGTDGWAAVGRPVERPAGPSPLGRWTARSGSPPDPW